MAKSIQQYDKHGEKLYPFSLTTLVFDEKGEMLETRLQAVEKLLEWFEMDNEEEMIKAKYGLYSVGAITAGGKRSSSSPDGGSGAPETIVNTSLSELSDVNLSSVQDGQLLMASMNSEGEIKWINFDKKYCLWQMGDVDYIEDDLVDGQVLVWDSYSWKWVAGTVSGGSNYGSLSLTELADVNVTVNDLENGQVLVWDSSSRKWVAGTVSGENNYGSLSLTDLTDVNVPNVAAGQSLVYDGSQWVARTISGDGGTPSGLGALAYKDSISFTDIQNKPTKLAGYGITDAISCKTRIDLSADYNSIGYGYAAEGWKGSGPAMVFGTSLYNLAIQCQIANTDYVSAYMRIRYNGEDNGWDRIVTEELMRVGAIPFDTMQYKCDGSIVLHRNKGQAGTYINYGGRNERLYLYSNIFEVYVNNGAKRAFLIGQNEDASFAANLTVAKQLDSLNYRKGGSLTFDPSNSFQTTIFGSTESLYSMRIVRASSEIEGITAPYAPMLALKASDTHGFISIGYNDYGRYHCYIGGGNGDVINWTGILFHNNMSLIPVNDNTFSLGDATHRWNILHATSIKIGDATLTWDSEAGMIKLDKGIYSTGAITAGGKGQSNKYRLDDWSEWQLDSDGNLTDSQLIESSLSARLGIELHTRLSAIEESVNLGPVAIDLGYISGTETLTPTQAIGAGLTETVITNLLAGRYTKVICGDYASEVWDYTCFGSNGDVSLFFTQGDGFVVQFALELKRQNANGNWTVNFNEI